jgi:hypothetical protein
MRTTPTSAQAGLKILSIDLHESIPSMHDIIRCLGPNVFASNQPFLLLVDTGGDPRETWEIPECAALCRRIIDSGLLSLLDINLGDDRNELGLGAADVYVRAHGLLKRGKDGVTGVWELTESLWNAFWVTLMRSNDVCDGVLAAGAVNAAEDPSGLRSGSGCETNASVARAAPNRTERRRAAREQARRAKHDAPRADRLYLLEANRTALMVVLAKLRRSGSWCEEGVLFVADVRDPVGTALVRATGGNPADAEAFGGRNIPTALGLLRERDAARFFNQVQPRIAVEVLVRPEPGRVRIIVVGAGGAILTHVAAQELDVCAEG